MIHYQHHVSILPLSLHNNLLILLDYKQLLIHFLLIEQDNTGNKLNHRLYLLKEKKKLLLHISTVLRILMGLIQVEPLGVKEAGSICIQQLRNQMFHKQLLIATTSNNLYKRKHLNH